MKGNSEGDLKYSVNREPITNINISFPPMTLWTTELCFFLDVIFVLLIYPGRSWTMPSKFPTIVSHPSATILPVTVSFSGFSQSKITNEGQPSTVTTVRLVGGFCGGLVAFSSTGSSVGNRLTESVMEQGLLSGFGMYLTWGPRSGKERTLVKKTGTVS